MLRPGEYFVRCGDNRTVSFTESQIRTSELPSVGLEDAAQQETPSATRLYMSDIDTALEQVVWVLKELKWVMWWEEETHVLTVKAGSEWFTIELSPAAGGTVRIKLAPGAHGSGLLLPFNDPLAQRLYEGLDERLPRP